MFGVGDVIFFHGWRVGPRTCGNIFPCGDIQPVSPKTAWTLSYCSDGAGLFSMQCAANRLPCSKEGRRFPHDKLTASTFTCMTAHKRCHNPTSWAFAKVWTDSGGAVRNQKLALPAAQYNKSNHRLQIKECWNALQETEMLLSFSCGGTTSQNSGAQLVTVTHAPAQPKEEPGLLHTMECSSTIRAATVNSSC